MMTSAKRKVLTAGLCLLGACGVYAQQPIQPPVDSLLISPGDVVTVQIYNVPELDQPHLRVTDAGEVPLVFLGPVKVAGLLPGLAADAIADAYTKKDIIRDGHALVTVESHESSTVTIFGYVNGAAGATAAAGTTGTSLPLTTPRPLLTVLSMAGGLSDRASRTVTIQRRDLNIKPFSVLVSNEASGSLANDPLINPGDIVVVPRAGLVYVLGNVGRPSAVVMQEDGHISLLEALSQAGSTLPTSAIKKLMIFRKHEGKYESLHVNLDAVVKGKIPDIQLEAEDAVWVPFSFGRNVLVNAAAIASAVVSASATGAGYAVR